MSSTYDLVIVGASFAGLACARTAALRGLKVLVVEKKNSPDVKLHTTGIIVKDAVDDIPWLQTIPAPLVRKVPGVRLYSPKLDFIDLHAPGYYFLTTDTPGLMQWMAAECVNCGVDFRFGSVFTSFREHGDHLFLGDGTRTRYLVGADGPSSTVAKAANLGRNKAFLYGIEHEFETPIDAPDLLHCFVDRKLARGYIAWAARGPRVTQIGVASRMPHSRAAGEWMAALMEKIKPAIDMTDLAPSNVRAGMIPCGGLVSPAARPRVLLVGDAAGMVSPVTAGGIHNAVKHGTGAGDAIADHLSGATDDPASWFTKAYPRYGMKLLARRMFDIFQSDAAFSLLLHSPAMRHAAAQIYFHRKASYYRDI